MAQTTMTLTKTQSPNPQANSDTNHGSIQLSFMTTGTVKIRPSMRSQPLSNQWVLTRRFRVFCDRSWTESMPIGVFLISHPDGPILFDTGESPHRHDPGAGWSLVHLLTTLQISREDGILAQLRSRGFDPSSLQAIVLSHLHSDHSGGLADLVAAAPEVPVYVSKEHWDAVSGGPLSKVMGFDWPAGFKPRLLERTSGRVGPWERSSKITADGKVVAVDTPGHVPGHISLVVYGDDGGEKGTGTTYFLAGDATYGLDLLDKEEPDGVNDDPQTALKSLRMIKKFARETDVVVLPSHDADVERLLKERVVYKPKDTL